jgi:hypothetical protein
MKKIYILLSLAAAGIVFQSSVRKNSFSTVPPQGYTGATGDYCTNCHSSFGLNSGGGNVTTSGLPVGSYVAGQAYDFSLTITHGAADRKRWGFSIKAVNSQGQSVGTFSSTQANAAPNGTELSHNNAVITGSQSSYTYTNLRWTAPANPGVNDRNVTFYYVGNAANQAQGNQGDYIYAGSQAIALPVKLGRFEAVTAGNRVQLRWQTLSEVNTSHFEVEKSDNAQTFYPAGTVRAHGNTTTAQAYDFEDTRISYFDKPVFYRLKIVDRDGSFHYSQTVTAQISSRQDYISKVYPTLVAKGSTIHADINSTVAQPLTVTLTDVSGRTLQQFTMGIAAGTSTIRFQPAAILPSGTVFAVFKAGNIQQTIPLLVP